MKKVYLCSPVLNRYDKLKELILSGERSNYPIENYYVLDNGTKFNYSDYSTDLAKKILVFKVPKNIGVAASWNIFLTNVPEIRIISNDDIGLHPDTIERVVEGVENGMHFVKLNSINSLNAFSFFAIDDHIRDTVGLFDENISPGWAYYEDNDYAYRMKLLGYKETMVDANVDHIESSTLKNLSPVEMELHHRKFRIAKVNYILKWGGEPGNERFVTPYGR